MLPSFILAFREGVEAALVIGILFSTLRKLEHKELSSSVLWGVVSAFIVSLLVAVGLNIAGASLKDPAEAIFEGITMIIAAVLLTWMIFWMHRQSRSMRGKIEKDIRQVLGGAGRGGLFGVAFFAVVREGIELALYLVAAGLASNPGQEVAGAVIGLICAAGFGWLLFSSTRRLPLSKFFMITNVLLIFFAAGLIGQGVHEFNELGWIPSLVEHIYNLNPLLSESSTVGQILKVLIGYSATPSLSEFLAYLVYFAVLMLTVFRLPNRPAFGAMQQG